MNNFKNLNPSFLLDDVLADCSFLPSKFRLVCIGVGNLGVRRISKQNTENAFWLRFKMQCNEGQWDVDWVLCLPSHTARLAAVMNIFLGVDPEEFLVAINNENRDFSYISILRNRYADFTFDSCGVTTIVGHGRDVAVRTFGWDADSIESGAVSLPNKVLWFMEKHPT